MALLSQTKGLLTKQSESEMAPVADANWAWNGCCKRQLQRESTIDRGSWTITPAANKVPLSPCFVFVRIDHLDPRGLGKTTSGQFDIDLSFD